MKNIIKELGTDVIKQRHSHLTVKRVNRSLYDNLRIWMRQYYDDGYYNQVKGKLSFLKWIDMIV